MSFLQFSGICWLQISEVSLLHYCNFRFPECETQTASSIREHQFKSSSPIRKTIQVKNTSGKLVSIACVSFLFIDSRNFVLCLDCWTRSRRMNWKNAKPMTLKRPFQNRIFIQQCSVLLTVLIAAFKYMHHWWTHAIGSICFVAFQQRFHTDWQHTLVCATMNNNKGH